MPIQESLQTLSVFSSRELAAGGVLGLGTWEGLQFLVRGLNPKDPDPGSLVLGLLWLGGSWYLGLGMLGGTIKLPGYDFLEAHNSPFGALMWLGGAGMAALVAEMGVRKTVLA